MNIKIHPLYNKYEFKFDGSYRFIGKEQWKFGDLKANGYKCCSISGFGIKQKSEWLHRAIYEAFYGEIPLGKEIDHIDNDITNNCIYNLQAVTKSENCKKRLWRRGEVRRVKSIDLTTKEEKTFDSMYQAGKFYGCSRTNIYHICCGKHKKYQNFTFCFI